MLILSQLESDPSNFMEIRQLSFLSCASHRIRPAVVKLGELLSYIKGCTDGWSGHTSPKLKSSKDNSNYLVREKVNVHMCVYFVCASLRVYIMLMKMSMQCYLGTLTFFCNDDCPAGRWAIIIILGGWQVPSADVLGSWTVQPSVLSTY